MNPVLKEISPLCMKSLERFGQLLAREDGFGRDEIIGTAAVLIIAAFVTIPGLRTFTDTIMTRLTSWWSNTIAGEIFPNS